MLGQRTLLVLWMMVISALVVPEGYAGTREESAVEISVRSRALLFATETVVTSQAPFNPDNRVARLPRREQELHLRPDFSISGEGWEAMLKPRAIWRSARTHVARVGADEADIDLEFNEWWLTAELGTDWMASVGRKVVLWGPSMFVSPSNPFFADNGKSNPYRELGGRDLAQIFYFPDSSVSMQGIVNYGRGTDTEADKSFQSAAALKLNQTGVTHRLSLILSGKEDRGAQLGGYGQLTASQALLLYAEGSLQRGTDTLYPVLSPDRLGGELVAKRDASSRLFANVLVGAAYSFAGGSTVNLEYFRNGEGYSDGEASDYYALSRSLAQIGQVDEIGSSHAAGALGAGINPTRLLLRRNYLFFQYLYPNMRNNLDVTLRYTHNLDDGSGMFGPIFSWNATDHLQLFALGVFNSGGSEREFGQLFQDQVMLGVQLFLR